MSDRGYQPFERRYLWAALAFAVLGGFGLAGHLSFVVGRGYPIRSSYISLVQTHGHLQLTGWVGLLLIGVSLHLLPRELSRPLRWSWAPRATLALMSIGLLVRSVAGLLIPYLDKPAPVWSTASLAFLTGACMESTAAALYVATLVSLLAERRRDLIASPDLSKLVSYLGLYLAGWMGWSAFNAYAAWRMFGDGTAWIAPLLDSVIIDLFIYAIALPVALHFSVKLLPLFLGLREPRWAVRSIGWAYAAGASVVLGVRIAGIESTLSVFTTCVDALGSTVLGLAILTFIYQLDILTRRHRPERLRPLIEKNALRGRGVLPDRGEYGRFEWFLYPAFAWLGVAGAAEVIGGVATAFGAAPLVSADAIRHLVLLGFISGLILGVGHRLLPSLLGKKLRWPGLVTFSAVLFNGAVAGRLVPRLFPVLLAPRSPLYGLSSWCFALSGSAALVVVTLFLVNLSFGRTASTRSAPEPRVRNNLGASHVPQQ